MRHMMSTRETALALGVSERRVHSAIRRTGIRWRLTRKRGSGAYLFDREDVLTLAQLLETRNLGYLRATLAPERA